jgi:hypothetical protein
MPHHCYGEEQVPFLMQFPATDIMTKRALQPVLADTTPMINMCVFVVYDWINVVSVGLSADFVQLVCKATR